MSAATRVEFAAARKLRDRNKPIYRLAHWPIWIFVFFIAPGPSTFELFEHGFDGRRLAWLGLVLLGTGIAAWRGRLPGVEPRPYIIRFVEDKPNPLYRRICYIHERRRPRTPLFLWGSVGFLHRSTNARHSLEDAASHARGRCHQVGYLHIHFRGHRRASP